MANDYATLAELKARIDKSLSDHDTPLQALLDAAASAVDNFCGRRDSFVSSSTASARLYTAFGEPYLFIDECTSITTVAAKDAVTDSTYTAWAADDWIACSGDPENPDFNHTPYTILMPDPNGTGGYSIFQSGRYATMRGFSPFNEVPRYLPMVQVTAKWGYATTVPLPVKEATILQAARWYMRAGAAWADALASGDVGRLLYMSDLDPDLKFMLQLGGLVRPAIG